MSTRRVNLGDFGKGNGVQGLRVSLPNYDVYNDDDEDVNKFSFNSQWTDIAKVVQLGVCFVNNIGDLSTVDQGFHAFIDWRRWDGGVNFYDDYCLPSSYVQQEGVQNGPNHMSGFQAFWFNAGTSQIRVLGRTGDPTFYACAVIYDQNAGL